MKIVEIDGGAAQDVEKRSTMVEKCAVLRKELQEVLAELDAPKVSDQCDREEEATLS